MLENIKSFFITKILFSYINDKHKLDLIKYNKKLQNQFSLNILDYRYHSGKYINYVSDSIIEEYNSYNDELIFMGGYLNGKRNIFGEEYFHDRVIYRGEYLNGKRHGKGKEYFIGILNFEDEYLNGKRHGKGKEYYYDGKLMFEGEYLNGKRWNGKGKEYNIINGELIFEGEHLNGERQLQHEI